ncbi:MAG: hypothetical protein ACRDRT_10850 [Pseudonocardiaceae bacterium]
MSSPLTLEDLDRLKEAVWLTDYSGHPDGTPNPEYAAATKPRFDRWIIDACTRPLDQDWLNYQHEIGLRHTTAKKNKTDNADSIDQIPMRYLLSFTAVVIATARGYLDQGHLARAGRPDARRVHQVRHAPRHRLEPRVCRRHQLVNR